MEYTDIERIYKNTPPENIPWNNENPPEELFNLIHSGIVKPCKTIDLGCGLGNYTIYLARLGFDITGVDNAPTAIRIAINRAQQMEVPCRFLVANLLGNLNEFRETFEFAYDWEVLHHIYPKDRERYIKNVYEITIPNAVYFSVCFAESDPQFGGMGKYRSTTIGTLLYFSSESEIEKLVSPYFSILDLKTITISGKFGTHNAIYLVAKRR